ncbi:MAG: hypothetical protein CFE26_07255 [Verrucomicrobiales bacterium VVV1]|nr:MAG: hypothetical protein CFE26_07255 [Verrucomicrobiales bacterium VVV1]
MATNKPTGDGHRNGAVRGRTQVHNPVTDTCCPGDRFQIFSWASEARSFATGAEPLTDGVFSEFVNLNAAPYNFDNMHKGHSAQFRSTIQKRWVYWRRFLINCDIPFIP